MSKAKNHFAVAMAGISPHFYFDNELILDRIVASWSAGVTVLEVNRANGWVGNNLFFLKFSWLYSD